MPITHMCFGVLDDCENLSDSYGEICVGCNCCGRIDKSTMHQCRIETYKRQLDECKQRLTDPEFQTTLQQRNIKINIDCLEQIILRSERAIDEGSEATP